MFLISNQKSLLNTYVVLISVTTTLILLLPCESSGSPVMPKTKNPEKVADIKKLCATVTCLKPPPKTNCYVVPAADNKTVKKPKGPLGKCCKIYRCFKKNGKGFNFYAMKTQTDAHTTKKPETAHKTTKSPGKKPVARTEDGQRKIETGDSVSVVGVGDEDVEAYDGDMDQAEFEAIMQKEFGFMEVPSSFGMNDSDSDSDER